MRRLSTKPSSGFTLIEMMVSLALGLVVMSAAMQLFTSGMNATFTVSQRAQMQQDVRAAEDTLSKDINLAGASFQTGAGVAAGTGTNPVYGCDQTPKCYLGASSNASIMFPGNYLYPIQPGYKQGITLNATQGASDIITLTYADTILPVNCYDLKFNNTQGTSVTFTLDTALPGCTGAATPKLTDAAVGLTPGDVLIITDAAGDVAIAEVTNATGTASPFTVAFATADPLKLNQPTATSGALATVATSGSTAGANRLLINTYFLNVQADPLGGTGIPRLMRQVSGHTPIPLAENVAFLQFTYDTYDSNGNLLTGLGDAGASLGVAPSMIRKVTIAHMTVRSPIQGTKGFQGFDLQTSVSARNLSFSNRYAVQ
jgi:prepilin-type N-terminal cleavage/methylation domain-containing protein